jgi:hypothetical protein
VPLRPERLPGEPGTGKSAIREKRIAYTSRICRYVYPALTPQGVADLDFDLFEEACAIVDARERE